MNDRFYKANKNEVELFKQAAEQRLPVMLTGPTGCGKTRLIEHMGEVLGRHVITISCHDDLTSADLVGRFMVTGGDVIWSDGPLTRAVKEGAIDYIAKPVDADDVESALLASPESKAKPPENPMSADRVKWEHIHRVFELCNRNVSETARRLKMHRRTLQRILSKRSPR
mgnify:CR=1 FL=1